MLIEIKAPIPSEVNRDTVTESVKRLVALYVDAMQISVLQL